MHQANLTEDDEENDQSRAKATEATEAIPTYFSRSLQQQLRILCFFKHCSSGPRAVRPCHPSHHNAFSGPFYW